MDVVVVPREAEVLCDIVGGLAEAHPMDRRALAEVWRTDAIRAGEVDDLPSPAALAWLARRIRAWRGNDRQEAAGHGEQREAAA